MSTIQAHQEQLDNKGMTTGVTALMLCAVHAALLKSAVFLLVIPESARSLAPEFSGSGGQTSAQLPPP